MANKPIRYCIVDAFTESAFKGNPAAVCLLEEERDEEWLQMVAREFNMPITCYLTPFSDTADGFLPKFRIRWFTSVAEVPICGHATLAASHFLFKYELVKSSRIEFVSLSGTLMAKKVSTKSNKNGGIAHFLIELDFPVIPIMKYDEATSTTPTLSTICKSLNVSAAAVIEIHQTMTENDILVVLESAEAVIQVEPDLDEIRKFPGKGILITGLAPIASKFDFASRFFTPKMGVDEDYVCGSAHCALAPYWSRSLGKNNFIAYQASSRSGVLIVDFDEKNQRVLLRGRAVVVMEGTLLV
ncbi:hypothetical protein ACS0TY_007634 [Phlomoides rotata]